MNDKKKQAKEERLKRIKKHNLATKSQQERKEIAKKGAEATNKIKAEKKNLKEQLEIAMEIYERRMINQAISQNKPDLAEDLKNMGFIAYKIMDLIKSEKHEISFKALQELIDRVHGKSIQRNELTGENGEPIKMQMPVINVVFTDEKK